MSILIFISVNQVIYKLMYIAFFILKHITMANEQLQPSQKIIAFKEAVEARLQEMKNNPPIQNLLDSLKNLTSGSFKI